MKISKSKQELARIISENGGWRDAEFAAQDSNGSVTMFSDKPYRQGIMWESRNAELEGFIVKQKIANWHQTVLSRAEYFHLYPAPDAKPRFCESVMRSIPEPSDKPTIEQLAADYRSAKDYAERKQQESDAANADADARLAAFVSAVKAVGLIPIDIVKPAIDACMQLVDMVPTRLQNHQDESVAAIGYVVNVDRLYDKVLDAVDSLK